jgi:hypothetical protein
VLGPGDLPGVFYYDRTAGALRFVRRQADGSWSAPVLVDGAAAGLDAGRYVSAVTLSDGRPLALYAAWEVRGEGFHALTASLRAVAATDAEGSGFHAPEVVQELATAGCNALSCPGDTVCVESGACLPPGGDGTECTGCALSSHVCALGECLEVVTARPELPVSPGLFPHAGASLTGEVVAVFFDSTAAELRIAERSPFGAWSEAESLGEAAPEAAIAVDPFGIAHVVYADRDLQTVRSLTWPSAATEVVEQAPAGSRHTLLGADPSVVVMGDGSPQAMYQCPSDLTLHLARRGPDGVWQVSSAFAVDGVAEGAATGFHTAQQVVDGAIATATWSYAPLSGTGSVAVMSRGR